MTHTRSRRHIAIAVVLVVVVGLAAWRAGLDAVGDALYAAMAVLLVLLCAPRTRGWVAGSTALGWCVLVELAQLTGGPARAVDAVPALHLLLGSTFAVRDLAAYGVGAAVVVGLDRLVRERALTPA